MFTTFPMLCDRNKTLIVCLKGLNEFEMLCGKVKVVEIINLCNVVAC
jgi:hypothetical protein